jgi:hypothetical protein
MSMRGTCDQVRGKEGDETNPLQQKSRSLKALTRWTTHEVVGRVLKTVVVWGWDWGSGCQEQRAERVCTKETRTGDQGLP